MMRVREPAPVEAAGRPDDPDDPAEAQGLLRIRGLRVRYEGVDRDAVAGIDLDIRPGEIVALVGEPGAGRSTTVAALLGLLPRGTTVAGEIEIGGVATRGLSPRERRRRLAGVVGHLPSDATAALDPGRTVGSQLDEAVRRHRRGGRRAVQRASVDLLACVGIDRPSERHGQYPHELTAGTRRRVLVAIALVGSPRLVVAGESRTGEDAVVHRRNLDVLLPIARDRGIAVLLVAGDRGGTNDPAQRLVEMRRGRIVERTSASGGPR